jgi:PAS domain-containing protein
MAEKSTFKELEQRVKKLEKEAAERKLIKEALWRAEEQIGSYQFIVESAHDSIFFKDLESRYLIINAKTAEAFGLSKEQVVGMKT